MSERLNALLQRLEESRASLIDALNQVIETGRSEEQIYSDGAQWNLRQLAIHLALADGGHNQMIYRYAAGKEFIPADYDINRYNKGSVKKQDSMTLEQALESLAESRKEFLAWVEAQPDDSFLNNEGRHATLEILPISRIMEYMYLHEEGHTADIVAMLNS